MNQTKPLLTAIALMLPAAGAQAVLFATNTTLTAENASFDGQDIVVSNCTLTVNGSHSYASLSLTNNAVVTHSPAPGGETNNHLELTIAGDVIVPAGCRIDADGRGYMPTNGPGSGASGGGGGGGGGHGGLGGVGSGLAGGGSYGDVLAPTTLASAGGNGGSREGGAGGGTLRVDGMIKADGLTPNYASGHYPGGGAGGSVWLTAGTLTGSGSISASGASSGSGSSGGGAGGRIALCLDANTFNGTVSAIGSYGGQYGGAGTIYLKTNAASVGELLVANGIAAGAVTLLSSPEVYGLRVRQYANARVTTPLQLDRLIVETNGQLTSVASETPAQINVTGDAQIGATASVQGNCVLEVGGDLTVSAGGMISADGRGYPVGTNSGAGVGVSGSFGGGGGGHGG